MEAANAWIELSRKHGHMEGIKDIGARCTFLGLPVKGRTRLDQRCNICNVDPQAIIVFRQLGNRYGIIQSLRRRAVNRKYQLFLFIFSNRKRIFQSLRELLCYFQDFLSGSIRIHLFRYPLVQHDDFPIVALIVYVAKYLSKFAIWEYLIRVPS